MKNGLFRILCIGDIVGKCGLEYIKTNLWRLRKEYDAEDSARRLKALQEEAEEAEKERIRAQRRAENPDGITENTSKKKLQQQIYMTMPLKHANMQKNILE